MSPPNQPQSTSEQRAGPGLSVGIVLAVICVLAGLLRWWGALGDFWLDEIWSLRHARAVNSPLEILTAIHHDNNHMLNTLYMYLLGERAYWPAYRVLALASGTLSVMVAGLIALRYSRLEAVTATLLVGCSYLLVVYSSEARGYGPAVFFALLGYQLMGRFLRRKTWAASGWFCLVTVGGFLSHLTFVHFYCAVLVWSIYELLREGRGLKHTLVQGLRCHALPVLLFALLYYLDIRHINVAGGPKYSLTAVLSESVALALGSPAAGPLALIANLAAVLLLAAGLFLLWRGGAGRWVFFAVVLLVSPALLLGLLRPEFLYVRYFLVCVPFFLLLLAHLLARCWRQRAVGKALYLLVVLAVCCGNGWHIARFLQDGRGHYLAALEYLAEHTEGPVIEIGGDNEFRNRTLLDFYAAYLPAGKQVRYYPPEEWTKPGPQWHIIHRQRLDYQPKPELAAFYGIQYELVREFRYSGLSGYHWFIYRLKDRD